MEAHFGLDNPARPQSIKAREAVSFCSRAFLLALPMIPLINTRDIVIVIILS
jgi:hypothetical protein